MPDSWDDDWLMRPPAVRRDELSADAIDASAARKLTDDALTPNMSLIYKKIRDAAQNGENTVSIYDRDILKHKRLAEKAVTELLAKGFSAKFHTATDQRDCDSLTIDW